MTTTIDVTIRMYHVGFGDCFLLTVPGPQRKHRVLIDCGVHAGTKRSTADPSFKEHVAKIVDDLRSDSDPTIDVVVVTHRHRDHVHGFSYHDLWEGVTVGEVWMPWVENPHDPIALGLRTGQDDVARLTFHALRSLSAARRAAANDDAVDEAIEIVYNSTANGAAFAQLHGKGGFTMDENGNTAGKAKPRYLPRNGYRPDILDARDLQDLLPNTVVHILGPSHDPRVIRQLDPPAGAGYLRLRPVDDSVPDNECPPEPDDVSTAPLPFELDMQSDESAYEFETEQKSLLRELCAGGLANPLELAYRIDKSLNGTSLVLVFQIGDLKLLFPGDAQWGSWQVMLDDEHTAKLLEGVAFYKVGHHGSHNATPRALVETMLIQGTTKAAMIPVAATNYSGGWQDIPKTALVTALEEKTIVLRSDKRPDELPAGVTRTSRYTEITLTAKVE